MPRPPRLTLARLAPILGIAVFLAVLGLLYHELRGFRFRDAWQSLRAIEPRLLALAGALTAVNYAVLAGYDFAALRYLRHRLRWWQVAIGACCGFAVGNSVGHNLLAGGGVRYRLYSAWGLQASEVMQVAVFTSMTYWLGYAALGAGVYLFIQPAPDARGLLASLPLWPLGLGCLALLGAWLAVNAFRRRPFVIGSARIPLPGLPLAAAQAAIGSLDMLLVSTILTVLLPADVPFAQVVLALLLGHVVGMASQVPGGLGVFEAVVVLVLRPYAPVADLVGGLLAFRLIYYFLPLAIAGLTVASLEARRHAGRVRPLQDLGREWLPTAVAPLAAALAFISGAVMLASGAVPAASGRLAALGRLVPLHLIELSHFFASITGVALLFLADGLRRRLDVAWWISVALLGLGVALSLLKGLGIEQAVILAISLCALALARGVFTRRARLLAEPLSAGWATSIALVIIGVIWLGLFSFRHVEYTQDLWWQMALDAEAPRSLRATVAAGILALCLGIYRLLRPVPPPATAAAAGDADTLRRIVARGDRSEGWLALLGDKQILLGARRDGFIMYGIQGRTWISLGGPFGAEAAREELVWRFRAVAHQYGGRPVFYRVPPRDLGLYADLGLGFFTLGEEARVPLGIFSLEGHERKELRTVLRRAERERLSVEVVPREAVPALLPALQAVSDAWLAERRAGEKGFSLGRFDPDYLANFPVALARQGGRLCAFASLWPLDSREELSIDLMRHLPDAPNGVMDLLFVQLMLWGRDQGYRWFNLGMAPLAGMESGPEAPGWQRLSSLIYRHGENFYNFQGLRRYKEKFAPLWEPRYLATPAGLELPLVLRDLAAQIAGGLRRLVTA
jgi:phosphatidylglycerol lysyltransferase